MHNFLCTLSLLLLCVGAGAAAGPEAAEVGEPLPLSLVQPGQRGYGLSVFSGQSPERFEVEVIGIWREVEPDTHYILARLSGMDLEESGVVAGMSGSPVYLDGRLAGAVAFAWPFAIHPIAGITPIESMRRLNEVPGVSGVAETFGQPISLDQLVAGELPADLLEQQLTRLSPPPLAGAASGVGWSAAGFGTKTREWLTRGLGEVSPSGRTASAGSGELAAGEAVAAVLVSGDMQLAATGTVTERAGDQILAFGHPFLSVGSIDIPMATAEVVTVLANQANSFKITNLGQIVGAFDLDRKTGIRGQMGRVAEMTPLTIHIRGDRSRSFELQVARLPMMTPTLVAISVLGALEAVTQAGGNQGLDLHSRFDLGGWGDLDVAQSFDGTSAGLDAALYVMAFADYLVNNHLERVEISGIEVELTQHPQPRLATLVEAHASSTRVRPGDTVSLNLDLSEYRGQRRRASMDVVIPTSIPEGRYSLLVGDGVSIDVARLTIEQTQPVTFSQALTLLESLHSRREMVVLGVFGGQGLAIAGEVLPRLPGSIRSLWGAAASSSAIPLQLAIASQQELQMEMPVLGAARIDLEVRRDGPLSPSSETDSLGATQRSPADPPEAGRSETSSKMDGTAKEDSP